jgi:hypothetical protein
MGALKAIPRGGRVQVPPIQSDPLTTLIRDYSWADVGGFVFNLVVATLLGALIAFHPQRLRRSGETDWDMKKSQVLICVMGVILVQIIRDNLALAFGLVGIGSFIRFRTAISNPVEGAIIFVQIMIGMACGGEDYWLAAVFTLFIFILLSALNIREPQHVQLWEVKTQGGTADQCRTAFERLAIEQNFRIERLNLNIDRNTFSCRFRPAAVFNVPTLDKRFTSALSPIPKAVLWNRID